MCRKNSIKTIHKMKKLTATKGLLVLLSIIGCTLNFSVDAVGAPIINEYSVDIKPVFAPLDISNSSDILRSDETKTFFIEMPNDGNYYIGMTYLPMQEIILNSVITVKVDGLENSIFVRSLWSDESKNYKSDRYLNEIVPIQKMVNQHNTEFFVDSVSLDKSPIIYTLKKGKNKIEITNGRTELDIKEIFASEIPEISEYQSDGSNTYGSNFIQIEAENYIVKSDSYIRPKNMQNKALYPYELDKKLLNVIDDKSFLKPGQWVEWEINVAQAGYYKLGFKYQQSLKENMPIYVTVSIDGNVPFKEMFAYPLPYTSTKFKNETLSADGVPMEIWLDTGKHTLRMTLDGAPVESLNSRALEITSELSDIGIEIAKLSGNNVSTFQNWEVESYFPGIIEILTAYSVELKAMYSDLCALTGTNAKVASNLKQAAENIEMALKKPKKIPAKLNLLSQGSGSATQLLSDFSADVGLQNISLDSIYVYQSGELPSATVSGFERAGESVKRFFSALVSPSAAYSVSKKQQGEINVWVNRPINYVETMQIMADTMFTPKTGIPVRMSVMPNEQKMILSNATDTSPDVVLGVVMGAASPYDLALRGAVTDFNQFPDFAQYVEDNFNVDTLDGHVHDGKIYGITETQDFFVLMYRKDIMDSLGIDVPKTWDDVSNIMPVLRRNGMNFFIPLSSYQGNKPIYATSPFIHQEGASFYSEDGHNSTVNSEEAIKGFDTLTGLYSYYSLQPHIPNFYNSFRYGTVPIGVGAFADYVKLMNAAPEIADRWEVDFAPGTLREDGSIDRSYTAADRASVIFESSKSKEQSWEFMKWWMSEETQTEFSYILQTKYGPEFLWNSANLKAFDKLEIPQKHKDIILEQWKDISEVPRHPAGYMLERELTNAWLGVVDQGDNVRVALDKAALNINREMNRKLEEFGYTKDGKKVKDYTMISAREILYGE